MQNRYSQRSHNTIVNLTCLLLPLFFVGQCLATPTLLTNELLVIAHRGASGYLPEHTLAAYEKALVQGADCIEFDLVMTKDGYLIARHDNLLDQTTDVSERPEFADRKTTKIVYGRSLTGWFAEDFTLSEIKKLRAIEAWPKLRPQNTRFDRQFTIPTLEDILALVKAKRQELGRHICLYPETKYPTHFAKLGFRMEETLVRLLHNAGYLDETAPVFIQSFDISNLKKLNQLTDLRLVQLLGVEGQPYDIQVTGGHLTYQQMATAEGLKTIARYADAVGVEKYTYILPRDPLDRLAPHSATSFIQLAHAAGLMVHSYTFRAENYFLPSNLRGENLLDHGDIVAEIQIFLGLGINGFFIDQPDVGVKARNEWVIGKHKLETE